MAHPHVRPASDSTGALLLLVLVLLMPACDAGGDSVGGGDPDQAAFVTRLGADTVAVEQITWRPDGMDATVLVRVPETTVRSYRLEVAPDGTLERYESMVREPGEPDAVPPIRSDVAIAEGDSLVLETTEDGEVQTRRIAADGAVVPFMDFVHWPFEWALREVYATGVDSMTVSFFTGRGTMPFVIRRLAPDSMTIQHPFRGTMGVTVDDDGRLLALDAGETTRKLTVERVPTVDLEALAQDFGAREATGQAFGPLSGRGEATATIDDATITVDYGVPQKRGREIFGELVPWGELWRTGANRATHLTTNRDLILGDDLLVPAGEYTLYTIPEEGGGTLIINQQTGQGGLAVGPRLFEHDQHVFPDDPGPGCRCVG